MSDISKCKGTNCPLRDNCKRYINKTSEYQSWIATPYDEIKEECEYYLPNKTEENEQ